MIQCEEKIYVGSTVSFNKRFLHHRCTLKRNKHKNRLLQQLYNEGKTLKFVVLEETSENLTDCEQKWIDKLESNNLLKNGLNINPNATGGYQFSKETIAKRTVSIKKHWDENGTDKLCGRTPWNKGVELSEEHKLKLRKPKVHTGDHKLRCLKYARAKAKPVAVYSNDRLLGIWSSTQYLEEWSKTNILAEIVSHHTKMWRGVPYHILQSVNTSKSCRENKPYKGLIFKYTTEAPTFCEEL